MSTEMEEAISALRSNLLTANSKTVFIPFLIAAYHLPRDDKLTLIIGQISRLSPGVSLIESERDKMLIGLDNILNSFIEENEDWPIHILNQSTISLLEGLIIHVQLSKFPGLGTDSTIPTPEYCELSKSILGENSCMQSRVDQVNTVLVKHNWNGEKFISPPNVSDLLSDLNEVLTNWKK